MIRFENEIALYLLLLVIPFWVFFILYKRYIKRNFEKLGSYQLIERLIPDYSSGKYGLKFALLTLAFIFFVLGIANPQIGIKYEKVKRKGIDIVIALDVSNSMLARDVKPSRLIKSKQFISNFIDELSNDRIGMVVFAGNAYLQMPLSVDYGAAKMYLRTIDTRIVPTQGTAIGDAVRIAVQAFESAEKKHKALVLITDGENHEGEAEEAIALAKESGIVIYTIGVGTAKGSPIPTGEKTNSDYKRDKEQKIVLSKLNEQMLTDLAVSGGGTYQRLADGRKEIKEIFKKIEKMESKEFEERVFTDYEDQFQYFLALALLLLMIEFALSSRKTKWLKNVNLFKDEA